MKATIEKGKVNLPREIFDKGYLPENGEISVKAMEGWLKIGTKKAFRILEDLKKPPVKANIDEIIKAEVVEDA